MCMTFGCNPQINFVFFIQFELRQFLDLKHLDTGYLVNATLSTALARSF